MVELDSKPHLMSECCVARRIEMLTYWRVRSAFNSPDALPSNIIYAFETSFKEKIE